ELAGALVPVVDELHDGPFSPAPCGDEASAMSDLEPVSPRDDAPGARGRRAPGRTEPEVGSDPTRELRRDGRERDEGRVDVGRDRGVLHGELRRFVVVDRQTQA